MKITRIDAPKFRIGRYVLNEYELRNLMLEICKGEKSNKGILIKDENGSTSTILDDGQLSNCLFGININSNITIEMLKYRRNKETNFVSKNIV